MTKAEPPTCTGSSALKDPAVCSAIQELAKTVEELHESWELLADRLSPVLCDGPAESQKGIEGRTPYNCEVARQIQTETGRLRVLHDRLNAATSRLEV